MGRKAQTPNICEWALGFSVDQYINAQERKKKRLENSTKERFRVEISTDDESEEDTLKIIYPRANKPNPAKSKKVRFEDSSGKQSSSPIADSERPKQNNSPKSSKQNKQNNSSQSSDQDLSGDSDSDSHSCRSCRRSAVKKGRLNRTGKEKKDKTSCSDSDSSDSDTEEQPKKSKKSGKSKKQTEKSSYKDSSDAPKGKGGSKVANTQSKKNKKKDAKVACEATDDNNVGPTAGKGTKKTPAKDQRKKKSNDSRMEPEGVPWDHPRRPNLLMPVRAEVLQVEHAVEGREDPRPNAFHDSQLGVVRVYHGPAYGNPYGMLYPKRDHSQAPLPPGAPHPLANPFYNGFAKPNNPGDQCFAAQTPWNTAPAPPVPHGPPISVPLQPTQTATAPVPWTQDAPKTSPPRETTSAPAMSGAINPESSDKRDNGLDTNGGPGVHQSQSSIPINVNMFSYGRPDPWSREGRERYSNLNRDYNSPDSFNSRLAKTGGRNFFDSSLKTNRGFAMYDREACEKEERRKKGDAAKRDLAWSPKIGEKHDAQWRNDNNNNNAGWNGSPHSWNQNGSANNNWNSPTGNDHNSGATWNNGWDNNNNNSPTENQATNGWDAPAQDWQSSPNHVNWGGGSNRGSNNSHPSRQGGNHAGNGTPPKSDLNWGGEGNNVGISGRVSDGSKGSKRDWNNNAGPNNSPTFGNSSGWGWGNNVGGEVETPSKTMPGAWTGDVGGAHWGQNGNGYNHSPNNNGNMDGNTPSWADTTAAQGTSQENTW